MPLADTYLKQNNYVAPKPAQPTWLQQLTSAASKPQAPSYTQNSPYARNGNPGYSIPGASLGASMGKQPNGPHPMTPNGSSPGWLTTLKNAAQTVGSIVIPTGQSLQNMVTPMGYSNLTRPPAQVSAYATPNPGVGPQSDLQLAHAAGYYPLPILTQMPDAFMGGVSRVVQNEIAPSPTVLGDTYRGQIDRRAEAATNPGNPLMTPPANSGGGSGFGYGYYPYPSYPDYKPAPSITDWYNSMVQWNINQPNRGG
jgi:hypothetical protein